jgi:hypothetical protein
MPNSVTTNPLKRWFQETRSGKEALASGLLAFAFSVTAIVVLAFDPMLHGCLAGNPQRATDCTTNYRLWMICYVTIMIFAILSWSATIIVTTLRWSEYNTYKYRRLTRTVRMLVIASAILTPLAVAFGWLSGALHYFG